MSLSQFKDISISTKTYNSKLGTRIDLRLLFELIPIYPYDHPKKSRGRKRKLNKDVHSDVESTFNNPKGQAVSWNNFIYMLDREYPPSGQIVYVRWKDKERGKSIKTSKPKGKMRNQTFMYIYIKNKFIAVMVFVNGKLTITGCKTDEHIKLTLIWLHRHIITLNNIHNNIICDSNGLCEPTYDIRMNNITYELPFELDRSYLNIIMNEIIDEDGNHPYNSLFDPEGSAVHICIEEKRLQPTKKNKPKYHTFLVYASGKVTMTSPKYEYMEDHFNIFNAIVMKNRSIIEDDVEVN